MIRLDPNLRWLYTELPMRERAAAAARDGFRGVEVAFPYDIPAPALQSELQARGLALVQILAPVDWDAGERGLACVPGREADFLGSIRTALDYAAACGKPLVHAPLGNLPPGVNRAVALDTARANLQAAAALAASRGITVIIEACCSARLPQYLLHTNREAVALIEASGCANLKLCFDTWHVGMEGVDLMQDLALAWPHVGHVQIGSVPRRHEPEERDHEILALLERLDRLGWDGWVGLEYAPRRSTAESLAWARRLGLLQEQAA